MFHELAKKKYHIDQVQLNGLNIDGWSDNVIAMISV